MRLFQDWLAETAGPDAQRLAELGLLSGPVVRWEVTAKPDTWIESDNPVIGRFVIDPSPDKENRDPFVSGHDSWWTLYLGSFSEFPGSELIELRLNQLGRAGPGGYRRSEEWLRLLAEVESQLGWAVLQYSPQAWGGDPEIAAYCINNGKWSWCKKPIV